MILTSPEFMENKHLQNYVGDIFLLKRKISLFGDIKYLEDKMEELIYQDGSRNYFCDYDVKNPSKEDYLMITETKFTPEQLQEKLNNE
jgi:hypothetical protein